KRYLLNVKRIITRYSRIKHGSYDGIIPRTFIFGANAAPGYHAAKLIIKLINSVADVIRRDKVVSQLINVVFVPDYKVSSAEIIIPAADLSEQISTAGMEASGTGNMKLALNGALTIGTWDGANIEIAEAVGLENIFIFGKRAEELEVIRDSGNYSPQALIKDDRELDGVLHAIRDNEFSLLDPGLFDELVHSLVNEGDRYFLLTDYRSYVECQRQVAVQYSDTENWFKKTVLNIARMGRFSSDRTIDEYAKQTWNIRPVKIQCDQRLEKTNTHEI
ncbi:MAG: glycogen/starch/alpha-glucan phosphorylase, partial [Lentisphaerae bacterium]|nr:glycogen/starch/alpha-glucan phosphorylase [Lentisphaerota bacterium]